MEPTALLCTSQLFIGDPITTTDPSFNPVGTIELRYTLRNIITFQPNEGVDVLAEDITSPELSTLLSIPLDLSLPYLTHVYIPHMVAQLSLEPDVYKFVRAEITDLVEEEMAESEGNKGFKLLLLVQATKVDCIGREESDRILKTWIRSDQHEPEQVIQHLKNLASHDIQHLMECESL